MLTATGGGLEGPIIPGRPRRREGEHEPAADRCLQERGGRGKQDALVHLRPAHIEQRHREHPRKQRNRRHRHDCETTARIAESGGIHGADTVDRHRQADEAHPGRDRDAEHAHFAVPDQPA